MRDDSFYVRISGVWSTMRYMKYEMLVECELLLILQTALLHMLNVCRL